MGGSLPGYVIQALAFEETVNPRPGWQRSSAVDLTELLSENLRLRDDLQEFERVKSRQPTMAFEEVIPLLSVSLPMFFENRDADKAETYFTPMYQVLRLLDLFSTPSVDEIERCINTVREQFGR